MEVERVNIKSCSITTEHISAIFNILDAKCTNTAKVWLRLLYKAEKPGEEVVHQTKAVPFFFFPKETKFEQIRKIALSCIADLGDSLNGSGWAITFLHQFIFTFIQDTEFDCTNPLSKGNKSTVTIKCDISESLPYSVYAALHPAPRNPNRKAQYKVEFMVSNYEQLSHYYKTELLIYEQTSPDKCKIKYHTSNGYDKMVELIFGTDYFYHILKKNNKGKCSVCPTCLKRKRSTSPHNHNKEFVLYERPICFDKYKMTYKKPLVVFADFEAIMLPTDLDRAGVQSIQVPCTACAVLIKGDKIENIYRNTSKDCIDNFIEMMYEWHRDYVRNEYKEIPKESIEDQLVCVICDQIVQDEKDRVHHHDHITGESIGLAHSKCNKKLQFTPTLDIVFHNFAGYDSKHIIAYLTDRLNTKFNNVVAKGTEKFLSFQLETGDQKLRFIDSYQFLSGGLATLYNQDKEAGGKYLFNVYPMYNDGKLETKFEDFTSWEMLDAPYEGFDSAKAYYEYYCTGDVLILAGVFLSFRDKIYETYNIDVLHCLGIPSVSWNASLKHSGVKLQPYQNKEMYDLIKDNIRGGYTNCIVHSGETDDNGFIQYFDINALYSWALTQALPLGNFEEIDVEDCCWMHEPTNEEEWCYFMVSDWSFPRCVHDKMADLPPFAQVIEERLVADLRDKRDYLTHSKTFHQALKLGAVPEVKRVFRCNQSCYFKDYIENNIELRSKEKKGTIANATFKLLNNALYGKTIENIEKYTRVKLDREDNKIFCSINEPTQLGRHFIRDDGILKCVMSKPTYVGFTILELSKWKMLDQWYNYFRPRGSKLMYMDTDSFIIKTPVPVAMNSSVLGEFKDELDGEFIDKFVGLCAKSYAYTVNGEEHVKLKGVNNKRKDICFEDYVKGENKKVEQFNIRSIGNKMYSCVTMKSAINSEHIDVKRFQCADGINTLPWGHYKIEELVRSNSGAKKMKTTV